MRWTGAPEAGTGPEVTDAAEVLQMIRLGRTVAILPRSLALPPHPDLVYRPVTDAPDSELVLAWAQDDRRRLVASFVAAAVDAAGQSSPDAAGLPALPVVAERRSRTTAAVPSTGTSTGIAPSGSGPMSRKGWPR